MQTKQQKGRRKPENKASYTCYELTHNAIYQYLWLQCHVNEILLHVTELQQLRHDCWFTVLDGSFLLGFGGYDALLSVPDVLCVFVDGTVTGKLAHCCNVLDNHL